VKDLIIDSLYELAMGALAYWLVTSLGGSRPEGAIACVVAVTATELKNFMRRRFELIQLQRDVDEMERKLDAHLAKAAR
jgi:hypothetical protein